jgi:flagellar motor protein MotB
MSKSKELLKLIGFSSDQIEALDKEDTDVAAIAGEFKTLQESLFRESPEIIDKLKQEEKKKGLAEAYTKAKKELNKTFSLGLDNKTIEEKEITELYGLVNEKIGAAGSEEVNKLNAQLFEISGKLQTKEEEFAHKEAEIRGQYEGKFANVLTNLALRKSLSGKTLIIPEDEAIELVRFRASRDGVAFKPNEKDEIELMQGEFKLKRPDNTGFETVETFTARILDPYVQKSNGSGGANGAGAAAAGAEAPKEIKLSETAKRYLEKMQPQPAN